MPYSGFPVPAVLSATKGRMWPPVRSIKEQRPYPFPYLERTQLGLSRNLSGRQHCPHQLPKNSRALDPYFQRPLPPSLPISEATLLCRRWLRVTHSRMLSYWRVIHLCERPRRQRSGTCLDSRRPFFEENIPAHWPTLSSVQKALMRFLKTTDSYKRLA